MSTLHALLFFGGIPFLVIATITLLVMAPSLAKGPRYRPGQDWEAAPYWFHGPGVEAPDPPNRAITAGQPQVRDNPGGASGRW